MSPRVAVAGASGYAGGELLRLVLGHPDLELAAVCASTSAGKPVTAVHPQLVPLADRAFNPTDPALLAEADLVFLALPHGESAALVTQLPPELPVVDLGADFRLADGDAWTAYYGGPHAGTWTYGLPELPGQRTRIAESTRVANTGCYAVAITLALAPLVAGGVVCPEDVVVVASSGTTGAGRGLKASLLASEVIGGLTAYKVGAHQHVPEIKQASGATSLSFTPILAPMLRGILATVTARPTSPLTTAEDVRLALAKAYGDEQFVHVLPEGVQPRTSSTLGTNAAHLQAEVDADSGRVIVTIAIDNLGKGAAGQAIQNANLMLGLPESAGLTSLGVGP